jgi:hypothetical protein
MISGNYRRVLREFQVHFEKSPCALDALCDSISQMVRFPPLHQIRVPVRKENLEGERRMSEMTLR